MHYSTYVLRMEIYIVLLVSPTVGIRICMYGHFEWIALIAIFS